MFVMDGVLIGFDYLFVILFGDVSCLVVVDDFDVFGLCVCCYCYGYIGWINVFIVWCM